MNQHDHRAFVDGCHRCEISADEAQRLADHPTGEEHSWVTYDDDPDWEFCEWPGCGTERRINRGMR